MSKEHKIDALITLLLNRSQTVTQLTAQHMCGVGGPPPSCRDGPWQVRAAGAVVPDRSGQPTSPLKGKGAGGAAFHL